MQKKILGVLFTGLLLGVGMLLYGLLSFGNKVPVESSTKTMQSPATFANFSGESTPKSTWIQELAKRDDNGGFIVPVNELLIHIDNPVLNTTPKEKSYHLVIDKLDRYSLFCVFQTLTVLKLPYMVIKEDTKPLIYIQGKDQAFLEEVVFELLKKYDIKSKIVEVEL